MNTLIYRRRFEPDWKDSEPVLYPEHENMVIPDQSPNNEKFYDSHGYMQSDVAILFQAVEQQNNELASSLRNRFSNVVDESRLDPSLSDDQMFDSTPSRFAQTASEVQSQAAFISNVLDVDDAPSVSSDSVDKIEFASSDSPDTQS